MAFEFKSNDWEIVGEGKKRNKKTMETKDRWVTLDNGLKYDPDTGETVLYRDDQLLYKYDPVSRKTRYGGNEFAGKLDPRILDSITEADYGKAFEDSFNNPYVQGQLAKIERNPFIVGSEADVYGDAYAEKKYESAFKPLQGTIQAYSMAQAYEDAVKRFQGTSLFDELGSMDFSTPKYSGNPIGSPEQLKAIEDNPNLSPEVKAAILGKSTPQAAPNKPVFGGDPSRPYSYANQQQQPAGIPPDLQDKLKEQTKSPDWSKLYDQISGYYTDLQKKQALGTPQKREQIGSFQQYSPTISRRQQSYTSSTPYSTKAG